MKTRSFQLRALAPVDRRVRFCASTADLDTCGTRIRPRGCRLDRLRAAGSLPLLYNHQRDPENILGRVVAVDVFDDRVEAVAEFRQSARADEVLALIRDGIIRGCSIGFCDEVTEPAPDGTIDVISWSLAELSVAPVQANPHALAIRSFTLSTSRLCGDRMPGRTFTKRAEMPKANPRSEPMNPAEILKKLGIAEGSKPEEISAALVKYMMAGADSAEDKQALVMALLGMLAPPSASSASDGAKAAAAEAMGDEVRKLQARIDELENKRAEAEKAKEETPEQRADAAIKRGQWPVGQRAALVSQYAAKKEPFLFAEGVFSHRSERITVGGAAKPVIEAPSSKTASVAKEMFKAVEGQLSANRSND